MKGSPKEVEGNSPLEDYFCHLSQNGINFLSRQVLLFSLNKNKKSRRGEVIDAHVLIMLQDDFRERRPLSKSLPFM
jgi:hypothetical protein